MTDAPLELVAFEPRAMSALLWGAVGCLSFLVCVQAYALFVESLVTITQALALAVLVGLVVAGGAYVLEPRLAAWAANRTME